jgi:ribosome-associated translation inhibitor RaiA
VWGGGHKLDGSDTDWKPVKAIDQTREKLSSQIRREHSKELRSHDHHRE